MAAPDSMRTRRAALLLHSLSPSVRGRVLARLPVAEASVLTPLLTELTALGIPKSQASVVEGLGDRAVREPTSAVERAERLQPEEVLRGVENCAPATVALLLRSAEWPWKREVISMLSDRLRAKVLQENNVQHAPPAAGVVRVLCECLCRDAVAPVVRHQSFGEESATRLESIRADINGFGTGAWPSARKREARIDLRVGTEGVGAWLGRLAGWIR